MCGEVGNFDKDDRLAAGRLHGSAKIWAVPWEVPKHLIGAVATQSGVVTGAGTVIVVIVNGR